jgi:uncharacterized iron-regulated protein
MHRSAMAFGLATLVSFGGTPLVAQDIDYTQHFQVFTGQGQPATLEDIVQAMLAADVAFVGETHTDPVGHWLEAELFDRVLVATKAGTAPGALRDVALSMEMFQRDVQQILDEYLQDLITEDQFKQSARPWEHYDDDYRPMVEAAKQAGLPVIAANAPRRYVNRVTRLGRGALYDLPARARGFLPPLPYPEPSDAYRSEWLTLMAEMPMQRQCDPPGGEEAADDQAMVDPHAMEEPHAAPIDSPPQGMPSHMASFMENGLHAQSLWDASMAYAITTFLELHPGALVFHVVGDFHVANFTGIPEQVHYYRPRTRSLVVSMEPVEDFRSFDHDEYAGRGDFVVLTDKSLDLDYERNCLDQESK